MRKIDIVQKFGNKLLSVENPLRYVGGEYTLGEVRPLSTKQLNVGLCFPDLYEIGMSNNALPILYDLLLSKAPYISVDRIFAVAPDFEELLRSTNTPLTTITQGVVLKDLDLIGFSIGSELAATSILQVLHLGEITRHAKNRGDEEPIIIAGGPAITNPLPFAPFFDFVYIGEAEAHLGDIATLLYEAKEKSLSRKDKIALLKELPYLWYRGKKLALRAIDTTFATKEKRGFTHYVVPNFKVAQDNGVVEIMRGCPNGCRFCHAGQYYKPYRQLDLSAVAPQVEQYVSELGYREITLSSLSSGDHPQVEQMIEQFNALYKERGVSFSLPSLKVSSFSLGILEQLSEVRKSGLTFAIETPLEKWQKAINKEVSLESVIEIIAEAKKRGWKLAKFYFMVGLPFVEIDEEREAIVEFVTQVAQRTKIGMNINIGTFIPKAHTPFQWAPQMSLKNSLEHLSAIKKEIQSRVKGVKVSYHDPWVSYLEGIISRGDEHISTLIEKAFESGCRLDAWSEYLNLHSWQEAINSMPTSVDENIYRQYPLDEKLIWDSVSLGVSKAFLKREWQRASQSVLTNRCIEECEYLCGICGKTNQVDEVAPLEPIQIPVVQKNSERSFPLLFSYRKEGKASFISHINMMRLFEMAFQRANIDVAFTQGYNPKPRMEFLNPLTTGLSGSNELVLINIHGGDTLDKCKTLEKLNSVISEGIVFEKMVCIDIDRKVTLSKHVQGSHYTISNIDETLQSILEKALESPTGSYELTKEDNRYHLTNYGEKNPITTLFGEGNNKFEILSLLDIHRNFIFASHQKEDLYSWVGRMWQL